VAFLDFDQELLAPRYRAGEQAMALLARAARLTRGRAGGGRLVIQTRVPDHLVIQAVCGADPQVFSGPERASRSAMGWPPFGALAEISGSGATPMADVIAAAVADNSAFSARAMVLGPRHDGRYLVSVRPADIETTGSAVVESTVLSPHDELADLLASVPRPKERVRIVVDPPRA
jgi:primosomal protein N' (replication factor Y)